MPEALTSREALIAELLGDVETLLARVEALPALISEAEAQLSTSALALAEAGDKYRLAVTRFTEEAKTELTEYVQQKAALAVRDAANHRSGCEGRATAPASDSKLSTCAGAPLEAYAARPPSSKLLMAGPGAWLSAIIILTGLIEFVLHVYVHPVCH